jgi:DNA-binding LytR/AlgR family response regulator
VKKISCIIADDEPLAREVIMGYAARVEGLHVAAVCTNGIEVYNAMQINQPGLLILDIQMPQLSGIELLRTLQKPPAVIITTAYREFALEGYELNVIDYLLKPVSFERFLKAIDKYRSLGNAMQPGPILQQEQEKNNDEDFIYVRADRKMVRVLLKDILYIEGLKDYVKIHLTDHAIITYQTLGYFEEKLSADHFIRIHRSYIAAINKITAYSATQIEIGKAQLPLSITYQKAFVKKMTIGL